MKACLVLPHYLEEAAKCADRVRSELDGICRAYGCSVKSNILVSGEEGAFAYNGTVGGAEIDGYRQIEDEVKRSLANAYFNELYGMGMMASALGFTLGYDKDGKHRLYGADIQTVSVEEDVEEGEFT